jgi:hypothetical protein
MELFEVGALVLGVTETIKRALPSDWSDKLAPVLAVLLGAVFNVYLLGYSPEVVAQGLMFGLTATGLYKVALK